MRIQGWDRIRAARQAARARRIWRNLAGPRLLAAFARCYPEAFFIEIGSNDGDRFDHLRGYTRDGTWRGLMVEPVPYVFERLREKYGAIDRIALENVAIADRDGRLPFFHLAEADPSERERLPDWYDAIGSFSRDAILSHADEIPDLERRLVEVEVPTLSFESLCRKHGIDRVDLLLTDTEGYDFELLKGIDLRRHHPRLLVYEHFHLSPDDRAACRALVEDAGYETMEEGFDTWCLELGPDDELTRVWRSASPSLRGLSVHDAVS